jgi:pimeloyl-ACP methyl ester carboxylesterase
MVKLRYSFLGLFLILSTIILKAQDEEVNPYKKLTKKFIGAVKRGDYNKNQHFFDSSYYGKIIEATTDKQINDFIKENGPIVAIERTEVDTQGCKMSSCTSIKVAKGKFLWYILFDQAQSIHRFYIDTFSTQWFYKPEPLTSVNYIRKEVLIETNPFIKLPGSLYLPINAKKTSAVVLVQGSGPHDRNGSTLKNKIYLDMALGLVQQGITVLAYDKRTYVYQNNDPFPLDSMDYYSETIDDAVAAIDFLKQQKEVDSAKVFIAGHSQGAMCAPLMAKKRKVKGLILLAAPARPLLEIIPEQLDYINNIDGKISEEEEKMSSAIKWQVKNALKPDLTLKTKTMLPFGAKAKYWLLDRNYKVLEVAKTLTVPIQLIQGGRDYNVTKKDYDLWAEAMSGKSNFKATWFEDLDHMYFTGNGMAKPEVMMQPNHVSKKVIAKMVEFVK